MDWEFGKYKTLHSRDVNNYVAVYESYTKSKGAYGESSIVKNTHVPIVFEAVRAYLLNETPLEKTIKECTIVSEFCSSRKVTGGALYYDGVLKDTDEYKNYIAKQLKQNKALEKRNAEYHKKQVLESPDSEYLGKVVRWYYCNNGNTIFYKSGNKVPMAENCKPMMKLKKKLPKDLNYQWYIDYAIRMLSDLGVEYKTLSKTKG